MKVLVSLIGEQPIPNLLAIRAEKPDIALLVKSALTQEWTERLRLVLTTAAPSGSAPDYRRADLPDLPVNAYDIPAIQREIERIIRIRGWRPEDLLFNLTGGTKAMAIAAYEVARSLKASFLYVQSEGKRSCLHRYDWAEAGSGSTGSAPKLAAQRELSDLITVDEYIRAYVGEWFSRARHDPLREGDLFEIQVEAALRRMPELELCANVCWKDPRWADAMEADMVLRLGSNFAVAEVKQSAEARRKRGVEQLALITRERIFGTYIQPILILGGRMEENNRRLAEGLGMAVIELLSWQDTLAVHRLSEADCTMLRAEIGKLLAGEGQSR